MINIMFLNVLILNMVIIFNMDTQHYICYLQSESNHVMSTKSAIY